MLEDGNSRCYICNKLTKQNRTCKSCNSKLRRVWWLGGYDETFKKLIVNLKYHRKRHVARLLGKYLAEKLPYFPAETIVSFIPTASTRVRRRGYDQAEIIARSLAKELGLNFKSLLYRTDQIELIGKSRRERQKLTQNAIKLRKNQKFDYATIILIDDVLTTGSSLESAAKILRKAGASHVDAAVIARKTL